MKTSYFKLMEGNNLSKKEAAFLLKKIIAGEMNNSQTAAVLTALKIKGETAEEITGFIETMRASMIKIRAPKALDIVGTGGDGANSFNISTVSSFVAAGIGVPVAKHGNRAASGKCGSADVLEFLGVNINLRPDQAEKVFKKTGFVFLFAPFYHPAMKQVGPVRKELGFRTIFNLLGPFLNPASTKKQLLGVADFQTAQKMADVAVKLNFEYLLLVSGDDGMDEISTTGHTHIFEIKKNKLRLYKVTASQFGIKFAKKEDLLGGGPEENAKILISILKGEKGPKRDIVLLNSAAAFYLSGQVNNIKDGIKLAEKSLDEGLAIKVLEKLIKETQIYG